MDIGDLYSGTVPEGTPICSEDEQIVLGDEYGNKTVAFKPIQQPGTADAG